MKEFNEILLGVRRAIGLMHSRDEKTLTVATFIMFITGLLTNLPAVILGRLVDGLLEQNIIEFRSVWPFIALIIIIILLREVLTVVRKYLIENIATQIDKEQTVKVIERLLKTDISGFLNEHQIGSMHGRIFRSIQGLIRIIKLTFLDFAPIFFSAVAAIAIALFQKPLIASVMILVIPAGIFLIIKQISSQKGIRVSLLRGKEEIDGRVVETLSGIETIRAMNTTAHEAKRVEDIAERLRSIEIRHHIYMALYDAAKYLNEGFFYILVILLSIYFASLGIITEGDILVYSILFMSVINPLREIHRILDQAHESSIQVNDLYDLVRQPLDESFLREEPNTRERTREKIVLETNKLTFSYKKEENTGAISGITIRINKGDRIGIAGASGCGKTTFVRILLRLVHGYKGEVYLFGKNLSQITRVEIAERIAYVSQRPFIFSGSIRENILYGSKLKISDSELISVSKKAHIYEEIQKDLGGFTGRVSENGNNLSGGQRQRLALARIMLQDPDLIVLDEATSALDNTNEAIVHANIEKEFRGKTLIIIAHRLTTLKSCDRIFVFDKGKIVQEGSYEKLAESKGLFQDFLHQKIN